MSDESYSAPVHSEHLDSEGGVNNEPISRDSCRRWFLLVCLRGCWLVVLVKVKMGNLNFDIYLHSQNNE